MRFEQGQRSVQPGMNAHGCMITLTFRGQHGHQALFGRAQGELYRADVWGLAPKEVASLMGADFGAAALFPHS